MSFCFFWQHKKNLADIFDGFTKKQTEDLWAGLNQMCANTLLTLDLTQDDRLEGVCIVGIYILCKYDNFLNQHFLNYDQSG